MIGWIFSGVMRTDFIATKTTVVAATLCAIDTNAMAVVE